jgi:uncharacterized OB-fold protein
MSDDWTDGTPTVLTSACANCGHRWYIRRVQCPRCGDERIERTTSAETGRVVAVTSVAARLDPNGVGLSLALVDLDDGIRILARCQPTTTPGTTVRWSFPDSNPASGPHVDDVASASGL